MAKIDDEEINTIAQGMTNGDKEAMESFFRYVDVLDAKKLKKDGRHALMVIVSIVEMLLPKETRVAYAAASDREAKSEKKKKTKKDRSKEKG
jgi:hypothetical protein